VIKDRPAQTLAATLAMVPLIAGTFVGLLTLLVSGLQCDESCTGEDWQRTAGAWQWLLYPALGGIVFVAGVMTFVFVRRRRPAGAFVALTWERSSSFRGWPGPGTTGARVSGGIRCWSA
jgi:hypothetical protein